MPPCAKLRREHVASQGQETPIFTSRSTHLAVYSARPTRPYVLRFQGIVFRGDDPDGQASVLGRDLMVEARVWSPLMGFGG